MHEKNSAAVRDERPLIRARRPELNGLHALRQRRPTLERIPIDRNRRSLRRIRERNVSGPAVIGRTIEEVSEVVPFPPRSASRRHEARPRTVIRGDDDLLAGGRAPHELFSFVLQLPHVDSNNHGRELPIPVGRVSTALVALTAASRPRLGGQATSR